MREQKGSVGIGVWMDGVGECCGRCGLVQLLLGTCDDLRVRDPFSII